MGTADFQEALGSRSRGEDPASVVVGNDVVLGAVHDHHGKVEFRHRGAGVVVERRKQAHRQPGIDFGAHVGHRGEGGLEHQCRGAALPGQLGGDRGTQGAAEQYDCPGLVAALPGEIFPRGQRVPAGTALGGAALALAVAAIVDHQHVKAEFLKQAQRFQAVRNVAGVTVEEEQGVAAAAARHKPAVNAHPVICLQPYLLVIQADIGRRGDQSASGHVGQEKQFRLVEVNQRDQRQVEPGADQHNLEQCLPIL